jgi:hypothetical protein
MGKLDLVIHEIETIFREKPSSNILEGISVVGKATERLRLTAGIMEGNPLSPATESVRLHNVGGILTTIFRNGRIVIQNREGKTLLDLQP